MIGFEMIVSFVVMRVPFSTTILGVLVTITSSVEEMFKPDDALDQDLMISTVWLTITIWVRF